MIRTLLIDDEAAARADLRAKLSEHPEIEVVGEAATVNSARELLATTGYDLVFLDVQLIGGDAFDLVPLVHDDAEIIFATGYDHYAVRAFEVNALDYLLKPIAPERLAAGLLRLGSSRASDQPASEPEVLASGMVFELSDVIYLRSGGRARFTALANIALISAKDNYSEVHLLDGSRSLIRRALKAWEDALPPSHFMRVHRTQIVNLTRLERYERDREERTLLFLQGRDTPIPVSRYRWAELEARLARLHRTL